MKNPNGFSVFEKKTRLLLFYLFFANLWTQLIEICSIRISTMHRFYKKEKTKLDKTFLPKKKKSFLLYIFFQITETETAVLCTKKKRKPNRL